MIDVHFATPLVHGMEPMSADFAPSAKRLVVIVADGLRADRLFELETEPGADAEVSSPRAPFLHRIAREEGRWGVSHARPPTESRPGLVSLLAGFYEDPSAITKGWHANAVEFDHLLNQSSAAWAIGAPSVVPLFASGISHIRARAYDDAMEDFAASSDHAALDEYVLGPRPGGTPRERHRRGSEVRGERSLGTSRARGRSRRVLAASSRGGQRRARAQAARGRIPLRRPSGGRRRAARARGVRDALREGRRRHRVRVHRRPRDESPRWARGRRSGVHGDAVHRVGRRGGCRVRREGNERRLSTEREGTRRRRKWNGG